MLLKEYKAHFITALTPDYGLEEASSFFYLLLDHLHQLQRIDLVLQPNFQISNEEIVAWNTFLEQLLSHHPIQYLIGTTFFYGLPFRVTPSVLLPRPETEELVAWVLQNHSAKPPTTLLDIGTGSGCIAISLAHHLSNTKVYAMDVSSKALEIATSNAKLNQVEVTFLEQDILKTENLANQFDVLVSNPPYVRELEKQEIKPNVLEHEPHLALFVSDENPLLFYRKIAELALQSLTPEGKLYFEINQYLGAATVSLLQELGFKNIQLQKDFMGNDRMIQASLC